MGFISLAKFQHDSNSVRCWTAHSITSEMARGVKSPCKNTQAGILKTRLPDLHGAHESEEGCARPDN